MCMYMCMCVHALVCGGRQEGVLRDPEKVKQCVNGRKHTLPCPCFLRHYCKGEADESQGVLWCPLL